jgi:hypothetical protein
LSSVDHLIEKNDQWRSRMLALEEPEHAAWPARSIEVRHGRRTLLRHGYAATLHHKADIDLDKTFSAVRYRTGRGRMEKGVSAHESLPEGGRWITVHPGGNPEADGHPVYIVPNPDGSHTITRGAGGKLNGMRLTGVKSESEYRQEAKVRRQEHAVALRAKAAKLKEQIGAEAYHRQSQEKARQVEQTKAGQRQAERAFVKTVASVQGVAPEKLDVPADVLAKLTPQAKERAETAAHRAALSWARNVHARTKDAVLTAYAEMSKSTLGDIGVQDIVDASTGDTGLGYQAHVKQMAAENGLTPENLRAQRDEVSARSFLERSDFDLQEALSRQKASTARHEAARETRAATQATARDAEAAGAGPLVARTLDTAPRARHVGDAVAILTAEKRLRQHAAAADEASDTLSRLPKAAPVVVSPMSDEEAMQAVADTLSQETMQRAVESLVHTTNQLETAAGTLRAHYSVGQNAAFNSIAQAVDGSVLDPLLVDQLGPSGAAAVLAAKWRQEKTPQEFGQLRETLAEHHIATQEGIATKALTRANSYLDDAHRLADVGSPATVEAAEAAIEQQSRRVELLRMAREQAGVARGRLEAAASLNHALMRPADAPVQVNLGAIGTEAAVERCAALGLTDPSRYDAKSGFQTHQGQFTLHNDGQNLILEVHPAGIAQLATASNPEAQERAVRSAAIKNGEHDDPDWLPDGISRRPTSAFEADPLVARTIDHTLRVEEAHSPEQMAQALKEHVGAMIQEGRDPLVAASDVASAGFVADLGLSPEGEQRYRQALEQIAPNYYQSLRQEIDAGIDPALERDSPAYEQAYQGARKAHMAKLSGNKEEFQQAFAAHQERLRATLNGYGDAWCAHQVASGHMTADEADIDRQHLPTDEHAHDALFRAVAQDPRTQNALLGLSDVDPRAVREYCLEKVLGVDPKSQEILSRITPEQKRVYDAWQALRTKAGAEGMYKAIQTDMAERHQQEAGESLFGDEADTAPPPLATVDLTRDSSVLECARASAQSLGYRLQVDPHTGKMDYLELRPGQRFYAEGGGSGQVVEYSPLTEKQIASEARRRIRDKMRKHFVGKMVGSDAVAETGWNPESVLTGSNRWTKYVAHMGGLQKATQAVQELMAGELHERFAGAYQKATGKALTMVKRPLTQADRHAQAVADPEQAESTLSGLRRDYAEVGRGAAGKFASGEKRTKLERKQQLEQEGPQLLGQSEKGAYQVNVQRASLGQSVEGTLRGMMPYMPVDRPVDVATNISMGGNAIARQRAIRLVEANERQGINLQAGGGKTIVGVGAFTHVRKAGKAQRALYVVPSNIVGQFGGEFLKFIDPKEGLRWHSDPNASGAERRSALGDANTHMVVCTPEALRDDVTRAVAEDLGVSSKEAVERMAQMTPRDLDHAVHGAMDARGWNFQFSMFDEAHRLLSRAGKPDAHMQRVGDSIGRKSRYYLYTTADVAKNDASECWSVLNKIAPGRYHAGTRDAFLRRYGRNTVASGLALRQELEPYIYATGVDIGVRSERHQHVLPMAEAQSKDYREMLTAYRRARIARQQGDQKTLSAALQRLSPGSFADEEPDEETVGRLARSLGTLRDTALNRVVNLHENGCKLDWICGSGEDPSGGYVNAHKGEPTVIFAHNLGAVEALRARLKAQGHRVAVIQGGMSAGAKDRAKNAFAPSAGEPTADLLICSDAAAMGANLQRGYHLINYDTPQTAMLHEQRIAREVRQGQKNAVSVHDLIADAPIERRARKRLEDKGRLREINTAPLETLDDTGLLLRMREQMTRRLDTVVRKAA